MLMAALGLSRLPSFRQHYLGPAIEAGKVEMNRPASPREKNQKYRPVSGRSKHDLLLD
jgi:hypothetical protein